MWFALLNTFPQLAGPWEMLMTDRKGAIEHCENFWQMPDKYVVVRAVFRFEWLVSLGRPLVLITRSSSPSVRLKSILSQFTLAAHLSFAWKSLCHNLCLHHISLPSEKYFCNNLYLRLISVRLKKIVYLQFVFHLRPSVWKVFCHNLYLQLISLKKFLLTPSQLIWKTPYLCSPKVFKFCKSHFVSQILDIGRPFHSTLQLAEAALKRQQDQDPENFMKA